MAFALLVGAGACSSDKADEVKAQAGDAAGDKKADISDAMKGAVGVNDECVQAAAAWSEIFLAQGQFMTGTVSKEELANYRESLDVIGTKVPSELKGDFEVMAKAWGEWSEAVGDIDMSDPAQLTNPATAEKLDEAAKKLDTPEVNAAQDKVSDYFENCGK
jgi:hypothetical protein